MQHKCFVPQCLKLGMKPVLDLKFRYIKWSLLHWMLLHPVQDCYVHDGSRNCSSASLSNTVLSTVYMLCRLCIVFLYVCYKVTFKLYKIFVFCFKMIKQHSIT